MSSRKPIAVLVAGLGLVVVGCEEKPKTPTPAKPAAPAATTPEAPAATTPAAPEAPAGTTPAPK